MKFQIVDLRVQIEIQDFRLTLIDSFKSQINLKSELNNLQLQTSVPVRNHRQAAPLADEAIDRPVARVCERFRTHAAAKRRELVIGFAGECRALRVVQEGARLLQELPVKRSEPIDQRLA